MYRARGWPARLVRRRRAHDEAQRLLQASTRGLRVPHVFGLAQIQADDHTVWSLVVMESVAWPCMRELFLSGPLVGNRLQFVMTRAARCLQRLYAAGCNHVDFGPHAVLLSPNDDDDVLIDFEHATFLPAPSATALAAHVGYFGWSVATNRHWVHPLEIEAWFYELWHTWKLPLTPDVIREFRINLAQRQPIRKRMARR
jgi:tRNA A-37 threonylcarbamoyl transferase component Bud32